MTLRIHYEGRAGSDFHKCASVAILLYLTWLHAARFARNLLDGNKLEFQQRICKSEEKSDLPKAKNNR